MLQAKLTLMHSCLTLILVMAPLSLWADEKSGHGHRHGHGATTEGGKSPDGSVSHKGMSALYGHLQAIEQALAAENLDGIHHHDSALQVDVKGLDKDTSLTAAKKKRVQGYIKNVAKLSAKVHDAADNKKLDQAKKEFSKLKAQVDLLDKQFAHSHKPGTDTASAHGHTAKPVEK
jgi:hypothetical protein